MNSTDPSVFTGGASGPSGATAAMLAAHRAGAMIIARDRAAAQAEAAVIGGRGTILDITDDVATKNRMGAQVPRSSRPGRPEEHTALVDAISINPMLNSAVIRLGGAMRTAQR